MDYNDKVKYTTIAAEKMRNGATEREIRDSFIPMELVPSDVDEILQSADQLLYDEYKSAIKESIVQDNSDKYADEISKLDEDAFLRFKTRALKELEIAETQKVNKLLNEGVSKKAVLARLNHNVYEKKKATQQILEWEQKRTKSKNRFIGFIISGVILVMISIISIFDGDSGKTTPYFIIGILGLGLVIWGGMNYLKYIKQVRKKSARPA